MHITQNPHTKN